MAHVGQEIRFGAVGNFGGLLGFFQLDRHLLGRRHIGHVAVPQQTAIRQALGSGFAVQPDHRARAPVKNSEIRDPALTRLCGLGNGICHQGAVIRVNQIEKSLHITGDGLGADPAKGQHGMAEERCAVAPVRAQHILVDHDGNVFGHLAQAVHGVFEHGHVLPDTGEHGCAVGRQFTLRNHLRANPAQAAVRHEHPELFTPGLTRAGCRVNAFEKTLAVLRHDLLHRQRPIGQQGIAVQAAHLAVALAHKGVANMVRAHLALKHHPGHRIGDAAQPGFGGLERGLHELALGDVGANRHKLVGNAAVVHQRNNRGLHPVQLAVLGAVADLAVPDFTFGDGAPQVGEKRFGLDAGIDHPVVHPNQLLSGKATDFAKLVIGVSDVTLCIGDAHNAMLVQGEFLFGQVTQCRLQIALTLLTLAHQVGHQARQGLQRVIHHRGVVGIQGLHQAARGFAQRIHGAGATGQLLAHAVVGVGQLH